MTINLLQSTQICIYELNYWHHLHCPAPEGVSFYFCLSSTLCIWKPKIISLNSFATKHHANIVEINYLKCIFFIQDGQAMLWDLNEGKHLYTLDSGDTINALCFSPNRYWLCAATGPSIKIWVKNLNLTISLFVYGTLKQHCEGQ